MPAAPTPPPGAPGGRRRPARCRSAAASAVDTTQRRDGKGRVRPFQRHGPAHPRSTRDTICYNLRDGSCSKIRPVERTSYTPMILVALALAAGLFLLSTPHRPVGLSTSSPTAVDPAVLGPAASPGKR